MNEKIEKLSRFAYSFKATVYHTYEMTKQAPKQGVFVECGVAAGAQIGAMCAALDELKDDRAVYAFDSFEGIPMAGPNDTKQPGIGAVTNGTGELRSSGITAYSMEQFVYALKAVGVNLERVSMVKGWFQYTVPEFTQDIALLRLDGDLYESTRVCLEHLLPKVVPGGIVIIDDYSLAGCRKACDEYGLSGEIVEGSGGVMWFIKQ